MKVCSGPELQGRPLISFVTTGFHYVTSASHHVHQWLEASCPACSIPSRESLVVVENSCYKSCSVLSYSSCEGCVLCTPDECRLERRCAALCGRSQAQIAAFSGRRSSKEVLAQAVQSFRSRHKSLKRQRLLEPGLVEMAGQRLQLAWDHSAHARANKLHTRNLAGLLHVCPLFTSGLACHAPSPVVS